MARKKKQHHSCTVVRRKLVTRGTLNIATGVSEMGDGEWVTEPCNVPLFGDEERKIGVCRSCASGWTHEHNYPITEAEKITAPDGTVWRLKRGRNPNGSPATGGCSWHACTGGAVRSHQWKFGSSRDAVLARIQSGS